MYIDTVSQKPKKVKAVINIISKIFFFTGIALLHYHLHQKIHTGNQQYLQTALKYIQRPLRHLKGRRISFLCGDAGPLAIGAVLHHKLNQAEESKLCLDR